MYFVKPHRTSVKYGKKERHDQHFSDSAFFFSLDNAQHRKRSAPFFFSQEMELMANFEEFFPTLLQHEGGYVDDAADPGGATNKGVTFGTFKNCAQDLLGIEPTLDALKLLSDEQAGVIYKKLYWDRIYGDQIDLQPLANIVFDFQVNAGAKASRLLQQVLNQLGANPRIVEDGVIGTGTMAALKNADARNVYSVYKQSRIDYYRSLVKQRPQLQKFLQGWLNRVNSFPNLDT